MATVSPPPVPEFVANHIIPVLATVAVSKSSKKYVNDFGSNTSFTSATVFLLNELFVRYRFVPSYSRAPSSGAVRLVPDVSLSGAEFAVAVPALRWSAAVGALLPIPTRLFAWSITNASLSIFRFEVSVQAPPAGSAARGRFADRAVLRAHQL